MARHQVISREAKQYIKDKLIENGEMSKSEIMEIVRPHCSFDLLALQEKELGRIVSTIVRSVRDHTGTRVAFFDKGADTVIHLETCTSLPKVVAIEEQLAKQMQGIAASHKKAERRRQELSGQTTFFRERVAGEDNTAAIIQ